MRRSPGIGSARDRVGVPRTRPRHVRAASPRSAWRASLPRCLASGCTGRAAAIRGSSRRRSRCTARWWSRGSGARPPAAGPPPRSARSAPRSTSTATRRATPRGRPSTRCASTAALPTSPNEPPPSAAPRPPPWRRRWRWARPASAACEAPPPLAGAAPSSTPPRHSPELSGNLPAGSSILRRSGSSGASLATREVRSRLLPGDLPASSRAPHLATTSLAGAAGLVCAVRPGRGCRGGGSHGRRADPPARRQGELLERGRGAGAGRGGSDGGARPAHPVHQGPGLLLHLGESSSER